MFDILMYAGMNVQIIVLACRKRLFARLGAEVIQTIAAHARQGHAVSSREALSRSELTSRCRFAELGTIA